jgi:RNA polymerase sigma-70 factor (sigma-E family)
MERAEDFRSFVDGRYPAMLRTATLMAGSVASGEDLLQEALLRTYVAWPKVRDLGAAEAYVRTTMVRLLIRDRRRRWSGEIPTEQLPEPEGVAAGSGGGGVSAGTAYGSVDAAATGVAVRAALRGLPVDQRVAIVLRYFHDLTDAQVADELRCPLGTVKSRISRGVAALRRSGLLADEAADSSQASERTNHG